MAGTIGSDRRGGLWLASRLNGVRPRWPEQSSKQADFYLKKLVSMESGLDGRNNLETCLLPRVTGIRSQWSPA